MAEELKDLIFRIEKNINALPRKKVTQAPMSENDQQEVMKHFAQTEKKYLKETKVTIEKNKAVNVSIEVYEKEKNMLVKMEDQLE